MGHKDWHLGTQWSSQTLDSEPWLPGKLYCALIVFVENKIRSTLNSPFQFLKANQASTWNWSEGWPGTVGEVEIIDLIIFIFFLMIIIFTSVFNCARSTFTSVSCRGLVTFQELWNGLFVVTVYSGKGWKTRADNYMH